MICPVLLIKSQTRSIFPLGGFAAIIQRANWKVPILAIIAIPQIAAVMKTTIQMRSRKWDDYGTLPTIGCLDEGHGQIRDQGWAPFIPTHVGVYLSRVRNRAATWIIRNNNPVARSWSRW